MLAVSANIPAEGKIIPRAEKNFYLGREKFFSAQVKIKVVYGSDFCFETHSSLKDD